jgi:8-oxo-dGTP pyrophosphatase MutT (NUDIX family)
MTVSAWILKFQDNEWKCLVHFHKKMDVLMQIGGHIELDETPWHALLHELVEESGFEAVDLDLLQFNADRITGTDNVIHPTPFAMNTHLVGDEHFHSDICYGFIAKNMPRVEIADDESTDLRWMSIGELQAAARNGEALVDVAATYEYLLKHRTDYAIVPATSFLDKKPQKASATYKRGRPGQTVNQ